MGHYPSSRSILAARAGVASFVVVIGVIPVPKMFAQCVPISQTRHRAADGGSQDKLGSSVAVDAGHALVGAPGHPGFTDTGAAYALRATDGVWSVVQKLSASDGAGGDTFGTAVAIDGPRAVVGADGADAAYVFHHDGDAWKETKKLVPPVAAPFFGFAVAVSGSTLVVGSYGAVHYSGMVFVYEFDGADWQLGATLSAPNPLAYDFFGAAVDVSGNSLAVGAYGEDAGAVYMFARGVEGWSLVDELRPDDLAPGDAFGRVVAISESTVIIGAPRHDSNGTDAGAAYVFGFNGSSWELEQKLLGDSASPGDKFGTGVGVEGDVIVVGAPHWDDSADITDRGAAYSYFDDGTKWVEGTKLLADAPYGWYEDKLGTAVAVTNGVALVGSPFADNPGRDAGHAYTFELDCRLSNPDCVASSDCDDGNTCTADSCDRTIGCINVAIIAECDDGNACTQSDACNNGACRGETLPYCFSWVDYARCFFGPNDMVPPECASFDVNVDGRVDLLDAADARLILTP